MSSLDKLPDWSVFPEREVPFDIELLAPASEMAALLQKYRTDIDAVREKLEDAREEGLEALAQQAVFVVQFETALAEYATALAQVTQKKIHHHFRVLKDQMLEAMKKNGLEIVVPLGKPFDEVVDWVLVEGWLHHEDFPSEIVIQVKEPIITYQGALIRSGRVVMGAPPKKQQERRDE
jgi:molecular chaperone GrpE (heat shock protein)